MSSTPGRWTFTQVETETRLVRVLHSCPLVLVVSAGHFDVRVKWFYTREDKWTDVTPLCPTHSGGHFSGFLTVSAFSLIATGKHS